MPASPDEFEQFYRDITGSERGFDGFMDAYASTGYTDSGMGTWDDLDGFYHFLQAYYPESSHSADWWNEARQDWRDWSDTDYVDWDALRDAFEELETP